MGMEGDGPALMGSQCEDVGREGPMGVKHGEPGTQPHKYVGAVLCGGGGLHEQLFIWCCLSHSASSL